MTHINAPEETMPVGIVGLRLPQLHRPRLFCRTGGIDSIVDAQHLLVLVIDLRVAR